MIDFYFEDETEMVEPESEILIKELLTHAAKMEELEGLYELSVTFMDDESIQAVNAEYRGKDRPTDVISFALEELSEGEVAIIRESDMPVVLGDIIISIDTAKRQAAEYNHTFKRELGFLALHGFLHLLGYDHLNEEDERKMFGRQTEILTSFGLERQ
ncbi:rRNA maturation RNase YbeY [Sporosarcina sp. P37]|uniref:rRNA maturation RNase YbeY n=1 Tax=unclassified Sporosarcina TaxID=2647733 RepID=UPI0009BD5E93|nr:MULTISPECIES: rRNA maturation RNase YbeY [unclassified Sporosarcina]ARD49557.1 rRNA maturation RNase YbeY [Sporosarcina sp. P33]ARK26098.1 rRNA maturation RNase YbeY [Sporosarcina sp. P37]PID19467.1 rRNA maturation RNase YbeY [Sporosarcina sp. P35]